MTFASGTQFHVYLMWVSVLIDSSGGPSPWLHNFKFREGSLRALLATGVTEWHIYTSWTTLLLPPSLEWAGSQHAQSPSAGGLELQMKISEDFLITLLGLIIVLCLNSVLNVKALAGTFNQEKALVGAFSLIVKLRVIFGNLRLKLYRGQCTDE